MSGEIPPGISDTFARSKQKRAIQPLILIAGSISLILGLVGGLIYWGVDIMPHRKLQQAGLPLSIPKTEPIAPSPATAPAAVQPALSSNHQINLPDSSPAPLQPSQAIQKKIQATHKTDLHRPALATKRDMPSSATATKATSSDSADKALLDGMLLAASSAEAAQDYSKALTLYKRAFEIAPDNYRIANNAASVCLAMGRYIAANEYANKALALKPDYLSALINAGISQGRLGDENGALVTLQRAVLLDPGNRSALYNLALLQERARQFSDAQATYKSLSGQGDIRGKLGIARIYERQGNREEAVQAYQDVVQMQENSSLKEYARQRLRQLGY